MTTTEGTERRELLGRSNGRRCGLREARQRQQKHVRGRRAIAPNYSHWCTAGLHLRQTQHPKSRPADDDSTAARSQHEHVTKRSTRSPQMRPHTASHNAA